MTRATTNVLRCLLLGAFTASGAVAHADTRDLLQSSTVRFQAPSELTPGWHVGTMVITRAGCAMVATPEPKMPGGRLFLGLQVIQKLERQDGAAWVDVPVKSLRNKEPKQCREAVGG